MLVGGATKMFDAVQRFRKVEEATSPKDEPAPVYLLDELVEMSNSSAENAQALVEQVVKKLGSRSPVVRFKALRLVKHMCQGGGIQFQRFMQKHSSAVRECVSFKGEPDPFKGDVPNERVRELAKQVIEILFVTQAPQASNSGTQAYQARIQGFGSDSSAQSYGSATASYSVTSPTARYQGFGNPRFENTAGKGASQSSSTYAAAAGQAYAAAAAAVNSVSSMISKSTVPTKAGALQVDGGGDSPRYHLSSEPSAYSAPRVVDASQVLGTERQLVEDICAPGGLRAIPNEQDLQVFADAVGVLDGLTVGELLREKMESESWQVVLRSLCALAAIVEKGSSQACGEVAVMFASDPTPIRSALTMPQAMVQQQAAKVLRLVVGEEVEVPSHKPAATRAAAGGAHSSQHAATAAASAAAAPAPDLLQLDSPTQAQASTQQQDPLDLLGDFSDAGAQASTPAAQPSSAPADGGMFSGLDVSAPAAAQAPQAAGGTTIDTLSWDTAAVAPAASTSGRPLDGLLDGLSISSPGPATTAAITQPAAPPSNGHPPPMLMDDLLGPTPTPGTGPGSTPLSPGLGMGPAGMAQPGMGGMAAHGLAAPGAPGGVPGMVGPGGMMVMGPGGMMYPAAGVPQAMMGAAGMVMMTPGSMPAAAMYMQAQPGLVPGQQGAAFMQPGMVAMQQPYAYINPAGAPLATAGSGGLASSNGQQYGLVSHPSWQGHDDLSALMRNVASHGKHDPAFDFIKNEFK